MDIETNEIEDGIPRIDLTPLAFAILGIISLFSGIAYYFIVNAFR